MNPGMLQAALAHAARGLQIFPCHPDSKRPLISSGVHAASCDGDQVRHWWTTWPHAMVGLACGCAAGFFVLDLDVDAAAADPAAELAKILARLLEALALERLPATWEVITPRGGRHLYFQMPADVDVGNRAALLGKDSHIDVRGTGGYVVLPPSQRADGKAYAWGASQPVLKDEMPAKAPLELLDLILRRGKWAPPPPAVDSSQRPPLRVAAREGRAVDMAAGDAAVARYAEAALAAELRAVEQAGQGERNATLNIAALRLGELVAAGALNEGEVIAGLERAADACGLVKDDGARSVRKTIASGMGKGRQAPRDLGDVRRRAEQRAMHNFEVDLDSGPPDDPPPAAADFPPPDFFGASVASLASEPPASKPRERPRYGSGGEGGRPPDDDEYQGSLNPQLAHFPMTDLGNAERFAARFKERLLWCPEVGWLWWDGRRWSRDRVDAKVLDAEHYTVRAIQAEARYLLEHDLDEVREVKKARLKGDDDVEVKLSDLLMAWGRLSEDARRLSPISKRARAALAVAHSELDSEPYKVNVLNGTLVVHRRPRKDEGERIEFRAHDPADRITRLLPVEYDPAAACPLYDKFFGEVQPAPEVRRFLHQWGGLSLTGDVSEEKLVFFWGTGQNGKTTLVEIWAHIAGDYSAMVPIETFINQEGRSRNAGQATPDLAMLRGARFVYTDEPEKGAKLTESLTKLLTGGNTISVRELNMPYFRLRPEFKLTMSGNYQPKIQGGDELHGIWRRIVLVDWGVTIAKDKRDYELKEKLRAETSGILNRLLDGLRDWLEHRLVLPAQVQASTDAYRINSDPLGRMLRDCTERDTNSRVQAAVLHGVFVAWARANGEREWTMSGFGKAMSDRGFQREHSHVNYWVGLKLVKVAADFVDADGRARTTNGDGAADSNDSHAAEAFVPL